MGHKFEIVHFSFDLLQLILASYSYEWKRPDFNSDFERTISPDVKKKFQEKIFNLYPYNPFNFDCRRCSYQHLRGIWESTYLCCRKMVKLESVVGWKLIYFLCVIRMQVAAVYSRYRGRGSQRLITEIGFDLAYELNQTNDWVYQNGGWNNITSFCQTDSEFKAVTETVRTFWHHCLNDKHFVEAFYDYTCGHPMQWIGLLLT